MKNFLTFTLVAGVAITTASVAHAAGNTRSAQKTDKSAAAVRASTPAPAGAALTFDRTTFNRELTRISDLLQPASGDSDEDAATVGKKSSGLWSF